MARKQARPVPAAAIVLFDDHCGFCTTNARKGMRYTRAGSLEWLGNSTPRAQALLAERGILGLELETLIVLDGERHFTESDAVVRSAQGLRWPWRMWAGIRFLPRRARDKVYRKIAEDRDRHGCHLPRSGASPPTPPQ